MKPLPQGKQSVQGLQLENSTTTLNMSNKEDKAKRDMLTQKENEVQDNIKVITENRNQFKIVGYNGFVGGIISYQVNALRLLRQSR
jgi:hypothetical protein